MFEIAEMLIDNAANLEAVGELGNRPLHLAAAADQVQVRAAQIIGVTLELAPVDKGCAVGAARNRPLHCQQHLTSKSG